MKISLWFFMLERWLIFAFLSFMRWFLLTYDALFSTYVDEIDRFARYELRRLRLWTFDLLVYWVNVKISLSIASLRDSVAWFAYLATSLLTLISRSDWILQLTVMPASPYKFILHSTTIRRPSTSIRLGLRLDLRSFFLARIAICISIKTRPFSLIYISLHFLSNPSL